MGSKNKKTQNIIAILSKTYVKITLIGEPNWFGSFVSSVVKFWAVDKKNLILCVIELVNFLGQPTKNVWRYIGGEEEFGWGFG